MDATPTRISAAIFATKVVILRAKRSIEDLAHQVPRLQVVPHTALPLTAAQSITPLWTDSSPKEQWYQRGKVENLRVAAASLNGLFLPAGRTFSFWRQVGKATTRKGYHPGRMLQEGCMIPAIGVAYASSPMRSTRSRWTPAARSSSAIATPAPFPAPPPPPAETPPSPGTTLICASARPSTCNSPSNSSQIT